MFKGERLGSWEGKRGADCALQTRKLTPSAAEPLRTAQSYPPISGARTVLVRLAEPLGGRVVLPVQGSKVTMDDVHSPTGAAQQHTTLTKPAHRHCRQLLFYPALLRQLIFPYRATYPPFPLVHFHNIIILPRFALFFPQSCKTKLQGGRGGDTSGENSHTS